jgi:Tfp pilus assembly protein PilF
MTSDQFFQAQRSFGVGDHAGAEKLLRDLLDTSPKHVAAWRLYAEVLATLERDAEANSATRRADAVEADQNADVGASLLFHGDVKRARTLFERALAIDPDCLTAHWLLGDV